MASGSTHEGKHGRRSLVEVHMIHESNCFCCFLVTVSCALQAVSQSQARAQLTKDWHELSNGLATGRGFRICALRKVINTHTHTHIQIQFDGEIDEWMTGSGMD